MNPPFIEFDMAVEGFGCIYAPSIAPQGISTGNARSPSIAESTTQMFGGLGSGERVFPPLAGLTFLTWLYVEQFSDPRLKFVITVVLSYVIFMLSLCYLGCWIDFRKKKSY